MKFAKLLFALSLSVAPTLASAMVPPCFQYVLQGKLKIEISQPEAGFEFPTDTPPPANINDYLVLKFGEYNRVRVTTDSTLQCGYFQEGDLYVYLPNVIVKAVAGIDFPTDGPAHMDRDFAVWVLPGGQRVRLSNVAEIIPAEAGIDFPTDTNVAEFHVMVLHSGERIALDRAAK